MKQTAPGALLLLANMKPEQRDAFVRESETFFDVPPLPVAGEDEGGWDGVEVCICGMIGRGFCRAESHEVNP